MPSEVASPELVAHVSAKLGRLLLANGADASYVRQQVLSAGASLGHKVHVQLGEGAVIVTAGDLSRSATRVSRALPAMSADMAKLARIDEAVQHVAADERPAPGLDARLDAIEASRSRRPAIAAVLGVALTGASLARLFGATWPVVGAAFLAVAFGTVLRRRLGAAGLNPIGSAFAVAFLSALLAAVITKMLPGQSPVLALTAAGMVLVPGVPLINGVRDLVGGHAAIAVARFTLAAATVLAIGFALFLAAALAGDALPVSVGPGRLPVWEDIVFSAAAVIGYAMLFDVPLSAIPVAMLCGVVSHSTRTALSAEGVNLVAGSLISASFAGFTAQFAGSAYRVPAVTFAFPGTVAMIPGSYGFRAAIGSLHLVTLGAAAPAALVAETLSLAITTAMMTVAIGVGLALAIPLSPLSHRRKLKWQLKRTTNRL
jgi:uncharacterized membrane protein YjjP (DUF1212 family)